ncbi:general secretion pathway protein D [Hydrogenophaga palleronii]|uniref:General secretion pathway protein D n=1 Tax=Hydrogenophaga palleronii TaxID=65655 RepID=A0ABU1WTW0_9BURK|nr:cohesin domain-containing protein [Hydrogenophaga palleronii]MDR7152738.1 general secretion pathway protein D [Hydrogenophaga palleronii]
MNKLEEAVQLDPKNAEYRIHLANSRYSAINRLIDAADSAVRTGQISDGEKLLRRAQDLDPRNDRIRQGLETLVKERQHRQAVQEAELLFRQGSADSLADALEKLRVVLAANPAQKDALALKARIDEQRAKSAPPESALADAFRKPISLEFRDAPLRNVLDVVAKVSGLNFFYDRDIRPDIKVTIIAKNTSVEDAVRMVLLTNQLEMNVLNENTVLIYPNTPQKLKDYQALSVRSFYLTNADVKAVSNSIKTIVKTKDMVVDERLGIIIMRDTPEAIRLAERIVALQDMTDPEVVLDVEILEVKRSRLLELGVQWPSQFSLTPVLVDDLPLRLTDLARIRPSTIEVGVGRGLVNARKEDQDGRILANPRIRVRNKEKAKVQVGDRVPIITTTSTTTGFASESVSYVDVGLKLEVEPTIHLDSEVAIKVSLEVSNLVREITSPGGSLSYQIGTRGANTVLRLKDGETQVLAGLISDEDRSSANKVPGLGELPIAGRLFGSKKDDTQRSEILLSITPRVVRSIRRPDLLDAQFESGTEASAGARAIRLNAIDKGEADRAASPPPAAAQASKTTEPVPARDLTKAPTHPETSTVTPTPQAGSTQQPAASPAATPAVDAPPAVPQSRPAASPDTTASVAPVAGPKLSWQAPGQVRVGEQFSMVLQMTSQAPVRGMPLLLAYEPSLLQVVSVKEGDYFKQGGAKTSFSHRVDPAQGKVFTSMVRQGSGGVDPGINGTGSLVLVTFKTLKAGSEPKVQVLSASPEPAAGAAVLPAVPSIRVTP